MVTVLPSVISHVKASGYRLGAEHARHRVEAPAQPFVTIARQAGAGGVRLAVRLAERLNAELPESGDFRWHAYDRDLVEAVANDHHLSTHLIDSLSQRDQGWLSQVLSALDFDRPGDLRVFRCTAATIRTLALAGRSILVGRGGVLMTRDLPRGVHVWLVAPHEQRVERLAKEQNLTPAKAAARVREIDHARQLFVKRYFPGQVFGPETFGLTLNCTSMSEDQMIGAIYALLAHQPPRQAAAEPGRGE